MTTARTRARAFFTKKSMNCWRISADDEAGIDPSLGTGSVGKSRVESCNSQPGAAVLAPRNGHESHPTQATQRTRPIRTNMAHTLVIDRDRVAGFDHRAGRLRQAAGIAWEIYPPLAILIVALLFSSGCAKNQATRTASVIPRAETGAVPGVQLAASDEVPAVVVHPPYPTELEIIGTAAARATIMHGRDQIDLSNLSKLPWDGARLWLNGRYSALLPYTKSGEVRQPQVPTLRRRRRHALSERQPHDPSRPRRTATW